MRAERASCGELWSVRALSKDTDVGVRSATVLVAVVMVVVWMAAHLYRNAVAVGRRERVIAGGKRREFEPE